MASEAAAYESDYDETSKEEAAPIPGTKRKFGGAAKYNTKFDCSWKKQYPTIEAVKHDLYSFKCTTCDKKISCKHMGIGDVKRHIEGANHLKVAAQMKKQSKLSFTPVNDPITKKVAIWYA